MTRPALLLDTTTDPIVAAQWTVTYLNEVDDLLAAAKEVAPEATDDQSSDADADAVVELVNRWIKFAPMNASVLQTLHAELPALGFTLKLSDPRGEGGSRTYVRVLRADGKSAGYLNATSFMFVGTRHDTAVKDDERIQKGGRYPYLQLSRPGALELVLGIIGRFATS